MSIEKEFVQYPEALELKEIEFNEPCFAKYYESGKLSNNLSYQHHNYFGQINAPTYSQAFRWFREKHKLIVNQERDGGWWMFIIKDVQDEEEQGTIDVRDGFIQADSYEEAELACLRKLIEIVKEKK